MKRFLLPVGVIAGLSLAMWSCVDKLAYEPTYAIPLVDGSLTVGDVLGAEPNDVGSLEYPDGRTYFQLVYSSELDSFDYFSIANAGGEFTLEEQKIDLKMNGETQGGNYRFTDPRVEFEFFNDGPGNFTMFLDNTYTRTKDPSYPNPEFFFQIDEMDPVTGAGWSITPAVGDSSISTHNVTNENTNFALVEVFEPVPKFMYFTPRIKSNGNVSGTGKISVKGTAYLPLQGYAKGKRLDTLGYELGDQQVRDALTENLEFALLRFTFNNGLPIQGQMTGFIVDTNARDAAGDYVELAALPLTGQDGASLTDSTVLAAAAFDQQTKETSQVESVLDININTDVLKTALLQGNAIIVRFTLQTTDYDDNNEVIFFADQRLNINVGLKFKVSIEQYRQELLDSLGI